MIEPWMIDKIRQRRARVAERGRIQPCAPQPEPPYHKEREDSIPHNYKEVNFEFR